MWGAFEYSSFVGLPFSTPHAPRPTHTPNTPQKHKQGVNVYLVGMMGSGKTTVGRMLAEGLGAYRWMDLDMFIEGKMGKTAAQVCVGGGDGEAGGPRVCRARQTEYNTDTKPHPSHCF